MDMKRFQKISMISYIGMGWSAVLVSKPLLETLSWTETAFLLAGGILYSVGAILYGKGSKIPYLHSIWHLFVLGGSAAHFFLVWQLAV